MVPPIQLLNVPLLCCAVVVLSKMYFFCAVANVPRWAMTRSKLQPPSNWTSSPPPRQAWQRGAVSEVRKLYIFSLSCIPMLSLGSFIHAMAWCCASVFPLLLVTVVCSNYLSVVVILFTCIWVIFSDYHYEVLSYKRNGWKQGPGSSVFAPGSSITNAITGASLLIHLIQWGHAIARCCKAIESQWSTEQPHNPLSSTLSLSLSLSLPSNRGIRW
jgi:hypothetical protein